MGEKIMVGNALEVLRGLEPGSVHCSVTSPPYYALRRYSGDQQCNWPEVEYALMPGLSPIMVGPMSCALGHEPTIEAYIGHLVAVYREVYRVLREDGVAWVVMGDSYVGYKGSHYNQTHRRGTGEYSPVPSCHNQGTPHSNELQSGDLMLVPHRLALALQGDGWLVRNNAIWHKVAPMPESVSGWRWERHRVKVKRSDRASNPYQSGAGARQGAGVASRAQREAYYEQGIGASKYIDCPGCPKCEPNGGYVLRRGSWRHTRSHEFVLMLSKGMGYFADQEAVRETLAESSIARLDQPTFHEQTGGPKDYGSGSNRSARKMLENLEQSRNGRNPRSVLSPSPEPLSLPHYAAYPSGLIEPLVKATCPARCCPECGAGWAVVVEKGLPSRNSSRPQARRAIEIWGKSGLTGAHLQAIRSVGSTDVGKSQVIQNGYGKNRPEVQRLAGEAKEKLGGYYREFLFGENNILGYRPTCSCARDDWTPGVVLDPFLGSGTTALVARSLGLDCIGIELSEEYVKMAERRLAEMQPPLFVVGQVIG